MRDLMSARLPRFALVLLLVLTVLPGLAGSPSTASAAVTTANLYCLDFVDASTGYAAGAGGTVIKTTNGGLTWTLVRSGDSLEFRGISFVSATVGYVVSLDGQVYQTADGGGSWTSRSSDLAGPLYAVEKFYDTEFFSAGEGVAVGTSQDSPPLVFHTYTSGGGTWSWELSAGTYEPPAELPSWPKLGLGEFYGVEYPTTSRAWAVGHDRYLGANKPVIWDWDAARTGTKWRAQTVTGVGPLYDVSFASTTAGLAVGSAGKVYRTTNAGVTWTAGVVSPATDLSGVEYGSAGEAWAVGASGRIFRTSDSGANWAMLTSPTAAYLEDIEYLGGTTAVAVGRSGAIVRTTNGTTWAVPTNPAAPQITSLTSPSHAGGVWVSDTSVDLAWTASGTSIVGYGVVLDQSPTTVPSAVTTTQQSATLNASGSGTWYAHVRALDALGQWGTTTHLELRVDVAPPVPSFTPEPTGYEQSASIPLSATDAHSGVASVSYSIDGGTVTTVASPTSVVIASPGTYEVTYFATDIAGNRAADQYASVTVTAVSPTAPEVTGLNSSSHPVPGTWVADASVDLAWTATGTNITGYAVVLDQSPTTIPSAVTTTLQSATVNASGSGVWYAHVRAIDALDQWSLTNHLQVSVDVTPPTTSFAPDPAGYSGTASVPLSAADAHSGVASVSYSIDGGTVVTVPSPANVVISSLGTHSVAYFARDNAGNIAGTQTKSVVVNAVVLAPDSVPVEGANRYDTAIAAARLNFSEPMAPGPDGHRWVVVASGTNWPDALAASGLAGTLKGPLLLTKPTALSSSVKTYIQALGADRVAVAGGPVAVSDAVVAELGSLVGGAANVKRYGGSSRYSTANLIAAITVTASGRPEWDQVAFVATGGNFPDALAAGPLSADQGRPLYLAHPTSGISQATVSSMLAAGVQRVIVLGGPSVVSQATIDRIRAAGITIGASDRWYGSDRYDTARVVAEKSLSAGLTAESTGIATGQDFPDALAGGVSQGLSGSVLVLTKSAVLSPAASTFLDANATSIDEVRFFGGTAALSSAVRSAAIKAATP